jgi:cardiolipin synthase A/B
VQHNFVQRWNEASERHLEHGYWGERGKQTLEFPSRLPKKHGSALVQIQRTIHAGRYNNGHAPVDGQAFDIATGEKTIFEQYYTAIQAAKDSIYIENQALEIPEIIEALQEALERGVEIVALLPITPDLLPHAFLEARAGLGAYPNFTLAGMAGLGTDGYRKPVWVHSKLMLIDDTWATIGSANLHRWSMFGNAELNAVILSNETVKAFRVALLEEHLGLNTSDLDGVTALQVFKKIAHANQEKFLEGNQAWQGLVVALDVSSYGIKHTEEWET